MPVPRRNFGEAPPTSSFNIKPTIFSEPDDVDSDFDDRSFFARVSSASADLPRINNPYGRAKKQTKYMPPKKSQLELTNNCVKHGKQFDYNYGLQKNDEIYVSGGLDHSVRQLRIQNFEECGFSRDMMKTIRQICKFPYPTTIQRAVIPIIKQTRSDIVAHSQTGSGKTAAFLLPIIDEIYWVKNDRPYSRNSPYCIILSPTRELAEQLFQEAEKFSLKMGVNVARSCGGMPMRDTFMEIENGCDILIMTIGRLKHHLNSNYILLKNLHYFVLDEGDKLIKEFDNLRGIEACTKHPNYPPTARLLIFSASFNKDVRLMVDKLMKENYVMVQIGEMNSTVDSVQQEFIEVSEQNKDEKLIELLLKDAREKVLPDGYTKYREPKYKTLIFVMSKRFSNRMAVMLKTHGFKAMSINSDRTMEQRNEAYEKFKRDHYNVLVATDVAARGWDIQGVEHVINYDLPSDQSGDETYIHRIGRTGRAGNRGLATSFFNPDNAENVEKAGIYIKYLRDKNNNVPDFLLRYSTENRNEMRQQRSGENDEFLQENNVPKENIEPRRKFDNQQKQNMNVNGNGNGVALSSKIQPKCESTTQMQRQNNFDNNEASTSALIPPKIAAFQSPINFGHMPQKGHRSPTFNRQNLGNNKKKGISFLNDSGATKYSDCF